MVDFSDKFDVTDRVLDGYNGWKVLGIGASPPGILNIVDRRVTKAATTSEAFGFQEATAGVPTTELQEVSIKFASLATATNNKVGVGCFGDRLNTYFGYRASVEFSAAQRVLRLERDKLTADLMETLRVKDVDLEPDPENGDDTNIWNDLLMRVEPNSGGFLIKVWLNNDNSEKPDIEFQDSRDKHPISLGSPPTTTQGHFYIWTDKGGTAFATAISDFRGRDFVTDDLSAIQPFNGRRAKELIDVIETRYVGSKSDLDFSRPAMLDLLRYTQQEIVNRLGDMAYFTRKQISFTPVLDDNNQFLFPVFVEKVHETRDSTIIGRIYTPEWIGESTEGALLMRFQTPLPNTPWLVQVELKADGPGTEDERMLVPSRFDEVLILGTLKRMFADDGSRPAEIAAKTVEFEGRFLEMRSICVKRHRMNHPFKRFYPIPALHRRVDYETDNRQRGY